MSYFAQIDLETKKVINVIVAEQEVIDSGMVGDPKQWIETSKDGSIGKNYAGVGYAYDEELDAFVPPKPFNSWLLDETTASWKAPVEMPNDGKCYEWVERILNWIEVPC